MYQSLAAKLEHTSVVKWQRGQEVEQQWIADAEALLGYNLPPSYVWWLRHYGNAIIDGAEILTLAPPEFREDADIDLIYVHFLDRGRDDQMKGQLTIFQPDPDVRYYFNLDERDEHNEYQVIRAINGQQDVFAGSFAQFLERIIDEYPSPE